MQNPELLVLENPGKFESLDAATADIFEELERKTLPLVDKIIQPFTEMNKQRTGFTNGYRPDEETMQSYDYGSVKVNVKTTPTTLKTNYKAVVEETEEFLKFIARDYEAGRSRKGVLTINNQTYLSLDDAINKIKQLKESALEGKEGVNQEVRVEAHEGIEKEGLEKVVFKLGQAYSAQTDENAADHARATALKKAIKEGFYKPFITKLKEMTGYDTDNLPEETVQEYIRAGDYLFPVQIIPKESVKYAKIIDSLIKPYNKKITPSTGELVKLQEGMMDNELARYDPRKREGKTFVRLETLRQRMDELRADYTSKGCTYKIERSFRIS